MEQLISCIEEGHDIMYLKEHHTTRERLEGASATLRKMILVCRENFEKESTEYYEKRSEQDLHLAQIQDEAILTLCEILSDFTDKKIQPTSSFSSRTNLLFQSDIDITVAFGELNNNEEKLGQIFFKLATNEFTFKQTLCKELKERYHVFSKYIRGTEIEVKIREESPCSYIMKIHNYVDNHYPADLKKYFTYIKFLCSDDKLLYKKVKYIFYNSALNAQGINQILPLI